MNTYKNTKMLYKNTITSDKNESIFKCLIQTTSIFIQKLIFGRLQVNRQWQNHLNPLTTNVPIYRNQSVGLLCKSTD